MLIYDELRNDHRKVVDLLDQLIATDKKDVQQAKALVQQIRDELVPHSRAEEAVLYNTLRGISEAKSLVAHSYQEHMMAETLLRSLQVMEVVDVHSINTAKKLRDSLKHHIAEEEGEIFDAARKLFTPEEAEAMGEVFAQMKPQIKGESFMKTTVEMIANMMPERFRATFLKSSMPEEMGAPAEKEARKAS